MPESWNENPARAREFGADTTDPFGDFAAGRYDRLAMAELARVELR